MNLHERIMAEMARQYEGFSEAVIVSPSGLAHRVFEVFATGEEEAHIEYLSLEHLKDKARKFLARNKDPDGDESVAYAAQSSLDFGVSFSGQLQDRYPLPRKSGEEPAYKLRHLLTPEEREWNAVQLEKSGLARIEHANALRAEAAMKDAG